MNKIKETFNSKIISKEDLKQKLDREISNYNTKPQYEFKNKKNTSWFKFSLAFISLVLAIGVIYYYNKDYLLSQDPKTNSFDEKKVVTAGMNFKSANYNIEILNNSDTYVKDNNILEIVDSIGIATINTQEIVIDERYSECQGVLEIRKSAFGEYTYQITSRCENENADNNLTIKKYTNLFNLHLTNIYDLQKTDNGYIALFGYFEVEDTSCETNGTTTICTYYYDTFALVTFNDSGDITNVVKYDKTNITDKLVQVKNFFVENGEYYIVFSEKYENNDSKDIIVKYDQNFSLKWTRIIQKNEINFQAVEFINNKLIIKSNDAVLFVLNTEDGTTEKTLEFKIEETTLQYLHNLEYVNGKYYYFTTTPSQGADTTLLPLHHLYVFDEDANLLDTIDLSKTQEEFKIGHAEFVYYSNENIIVNNQKVLTVYDKNANFIRTIDYSEVILDGGTFLTLQIIFLKNNDILIINRQGNKYLIEKFNTKVELLKSDIYGLADEINADNYYGSFYVNDEELTSYSFNNLENGSLTILLFN